MLCSGLPFAHSCYTRCSPAWTSMQSSIVRHTFFCTLVLPYARYLPLFGGWKSWVDIFGPPLFAELWFLDILDFVEVPPQSQNIFSNVSFCPPATMSSGDSARDLEFIDELSDRFVRTLKTLQSMIIAAFIASTVSEPAQGQQSNKAHRLIFVGSTHF